MTINSLSVIQGTPLKKVGDSVKAGEIIVAGYFIDTNGHKIECKANANISASIWYSQTENYQKIKAVNIRTGNKIVNSKMVLFGINFPVKTKQNTFQNFEIEENLNPIFKNNFLPFYMYTTTYFETKIEYQQQNFEADKQTVLDKLKNEVIRSVPKQLTISKTFETITETADAFVVTYYAQVEVNL